MIKTVTRIINIVMKEITAPIVAPAAITDDVLCLLWVVCFDSEVVMPSRGLVVLVALKESM